MNSILAQFSRFDAFMLVCLIVGGFFAVRNGRQTQLAKFQEDNNKALKQRIEILEVKAADFEKENVVQRHLIETLISAFKQKGMIVTIDGDMVTICKCWNYVSRILTIT